MTDNVQAIEIENDDCVIVFSSDGVKAYIPPVDGIQDMTNHMLICMAIAHLATQDSQWMTETVNRYNESLEAIKQELN